MTEKHYTVRAYAYNTCLNYYGHEIEGHWQDWSGEHELTFPTREAAEDFEQEERPRFGLGYNLEIQEHETEYIFQVSQTFSTLGDPNELDFNTEQEAENAARELRESLSQMIQSWIIWCKPTTGDSKEIQTWEEAWKMFCVESWLFCRDKWTREAADYIAEQAVRIERVSL